MAGRRETLVEAVQALPEHLRLPLALQFASGLTLQEVAEVMDVPLMDVVYRVNSALDMLRPALQPFIASGMH